MVQAKAEREACLRELETGGRAHEVFGAGAQLLVSEPGFVIKTRETGCSGGKVFINVCTSKKVTPAMVGGGNLRQASCEKEERHACYCPHGPSLTRPTAASLVCAGWIAALPAL
jgi:hypothetical protein